MRDVKQRFLRGLSWSFRCIGNLADAQKTGGFMYKMKRLKPALALLLAAAMALSGPAQSAGFVRAEEVAAEENMKARDAKDENADAVDSQLQEAQDVEEATSETDGKEPETQASESEETASAEAQTSEETSALELETEAASETGDIASAEETTEAETAETESVSEEEAQEADELKISGTEMNNAAPLSVGKNEITVKADETGKWYYFEPKEDGAYFVRITDAGYDCFFNMSGVKKPLYDEEYYDDERQEVRFLGKAGERVYFQPYLYSSRYFDDDYQGPDREEFSTPAVIEVYAAKKGSISKDNDGKYTLSYGENVNLSLDVNAFNTSIIWDIKDNADNKGRSCYAYCSGETYGYAGSAFWALDMDETYHIDYVLCDESAVIENASDDAFVWFGGIDVTTKSSDKEGGVITKVTAGFADIAVDYELFWSDPRYDDGFIRYKEDGAEEWNHVWSYYDMDTADIFPVRTQTRYIIELVSEDKKTVYDSRQVTTGKYEGKVTATVNLNSIDTESAQIDITGYDTKDVNYTYVYAWYTDYKGLEKKREFYVSSEKLQSGTITVRLDDLAAGAEYKDVKLWMRQWDKSYKRTTVYAGTVSFTTKEILIKTEDIHVEITPHESDYDRANVNVQVDFPSGEPYHRIRGEYRRKGAADWRNLGEANVSSIDNTVTWEMYNLEETDYELRFQVGNVTKQQEYKHKPVIATDNAKVDIKVKNTFVNGFEIEAALSGAETGSAYTCLFESAGKDGWWHHGSTKLTLDPSRPVTEKIYSGQMSGEKERWRYLVYKNDSLCQIGYLDEAQTQTKPLELDVLSAETDANYIKVTCRVKNWSEVIKDEDNKAEIGTYVMLRKKGEEKWEEVFDSIWFRFDEDGMADRGIYLYNWHDDCEIKLDPTAQYELCLASSFDDDRITYAQTTFVPTASWEVPEENNFVYNSANTRRSITISGNYSKPTVKVENDNIVSIREIRQSRIYLDIHSVGTTKLDVTADGITKTINVTVSPFAENLFFFEGADESLKDIALPANFEWVNPSESPKADDVNKIQYFDVTIDEADGKKSGKVPIAVSTLEADKIEIQGKDIIGFGKDGVYGAYHTGTGFVENYYAEAQAYEISHEWTGDDGLVIKKGGKERTVTVTGKTAGTHELTLTVKVKSFQTGNSLERKKTLQINVLEKGIIDNLIIWPAKEQPVDAVPKMVTGSVVSGYMVTGSVVSGQVIEINCDDFDLSQKNKLKLEAKTNKENDAGETVCEDISVEWAGENILDVDADGLVTIKGRGEGNLRVTAKDAGKYSVPVLFKVYDGSPRFKSTEYEVQTGSAEGVRLSYEEREGNRITGMAVSGNDKLETIRPRGDTCWYLRTKAEYTAETTEQVTLKITTKNGKTYDQQITVTILPEPKEPSDPDVEGFIDNLIIKPAKEQPADAIPCMVSGSVVSGQVIEINCEGYDLSKNNKLQLEAKTDKGTKNEAGEPVLDDVSVRWSSENEDIFVIDEKGLVTVKNKGEGMLKATAEDEGGYTESVLFKIYDTSPDPDVEIYDNPPVFEITEITVRDGSAEGTRLSFQEKDDNRVTGMTLTGSDRLEVVQHTGDDFGWYVRTKARYTEETTENITLKITTENQKTYDQPLKVTVLPEPKMTLDPDVNTGTVTFAQTAIPNLFYVNSEAVFDVTSSYEDYEIEDIRTIEKDKDAQNFHVKSYNAEEKTIIFTANKLDTNSVASYAAKNSSSAVANVEVKFKGYAGYYPEDGSGISIRVAVQNNPASALKAEDAVVTGSINTAQVEVLDKKEVFDLSGSSFAIVSEKTKAENLTASVENGSLKLTQTGENAKGGKYTFNVTNPNWTKVLTLTGKISRVDVAKLTMKMSRTKATLNTTNNDSVKISLSVKGNASLPVVIETGVKPVTDALAIKVSEDNKDITLGVAEGKSLALGKYTISVAGTIGEEKTKATKLTLTVTDKTPEVKFSAKGSINILNRDLSGITYTAAIKNTDAEIESAEITGDSVSTFKVVKNDGKKLTLKALKGAKDINTKKPYEVKLKLTLSNGAVIENVKGVTLKVKPVDKLPKIKLDAPRKPAISKAAKGGVAVQLDMEAGYRIAKVELDGKDKDKFAVTQNGQSAFTISLAENADSIVAKSYSVKYKLYFDGANATTRQITKSIKIKVTE